MLRRLLQKIRRKRGNPSDDQQHANVSEQPSASPSQPAREQDDASNTHMQQNIKARPAEIDDQVPQPSVGENGLAAQIADLKRQTTELAARYAEAVSETERAASEARFHATTAATAAEAATCALERHAGLSHETSSQIAPVSSVINAMSDRLATSEAQLNNSGKALAAAQVQIARLEAKLEGQYIETCRLRAQHDAALTSAEDRIQDYAFHVRDLHERLERALAGFDPSKWEPSAGFETFASAKSRVTGETGMRSTEQYAEFQRDIAAASLSVAASAAVSNAERPQHASHQAVVALHAQVQDLRSQLEAALGESQQAAVAASDHAAACAAAAALAQRLALTQHRKSEHVDVSAVMHEMEEKLKDAEERAARAETLLAARKSSSESGGLEEQERASISASAASSAIAAARSLLGSRHENVDAAVQALSQGLDEALNAASIAQSDRTLLEQRCKQAEEAAQAARAQHEQDIAELTGHVEALKIEVNAAAAKTSSTLSELQQVVEDQKEAVHAAAVALGRDSLEVSLPGAVALLVHALNETRSVSEERTAMQLPPERKGHEVWNPATAEGSSSSMTTSLYCSAESSSSPQQTLVGAPQTEAEASPTTPALIGTNDADHLNRQVRQLQRDLRQREADIQRLLESIPDLHIGEGGKIVAPSSSPVPPAVDTLRQRLEAEQRSRQEVLTAYADVKAQLKEKILELDLAKSEVRRARAEANTERIRSPRTPSRGAVGSIDGDSDSIGEKLSPRDSSTPSKTSHMASTSQPNVEVGEGEGEPTIGHMALKDDDVDEHAAVDAPQLSDIDLKVLESVSLHLKVRQLEEQNQALSTRLKNMEDELLSTRELLGHGNANQRLQYHRRLKTQIEEMRHEATMALREQFVLEQCVRYLSVRAGLLRGRKPSDVLRPESLAGRSGLAVSTSTDRSALEEGEAAARAAAEVDVLRTIKEVCGK